MNYSDIKTKKGRIEFLKEKLASDARWALRGLVRIYEYQTEEEKAIEGTRENNGVGFTGVDGDILSSFAKQVMMGRNLSPKQSVILFKKMPKYASQLERVASSK